MPNVFVCVKVLIVTACVGCKRVWPYFRVVKKEKTIEIVWNANGWTESADPGWKPLKSWNQSATQLKQENIKTNKNHMLHCNVMTNRKKGNVNTCLQVISIHEWSSEWPSWLKWKSNWQPASPGAMMKEMFFIFSKWQKRKTFKLYAVKEEVCSFKDFKPTFWAENSPFMADKSKTERSLTRFQYRQTMTRRFSVLVKNDSNYVIRNEWKMNKTTRNW